MRNDIIELCLVQECTGCFACEFACKKAAIRREKNDEGFEYPKINHDVCVSCHACQKICPVLSPIAKFIEGDVYASWSKNENIRSKSSSGGMFSVFAEQILSEGGAVVGAQMDEDYYVRHIVICEQADLDKLRGSKYVQSIISHELYIEIQKRLHAGQKILFCGTPCQVAAIRKAFRNNQLLFTIDLVCHGVPSPDFFAGFMRRLKKRIPNMVSYQFRDYKNWLVCTNVNVNVNVNGQISTRYLYGEPTFYQDAFLKGYLHRENCYSCRYTTISRVGDITLADFWGIGKERPIDENYKGGCSMMSVNSANGRDLLDIVKDKIFYEERDIQETINGGNEQLVSPTTRTIERDTFYKDANLLNYKKLIKKYNLKLRKKTTILQRIMKKIKSVLKYHTNEEKKEKNITYHNL